MKLVVISHTPHYLIDGQLRGWGPTVIELDYLAGLFDSLVHLAPVHTGAAPASMLPYASSKVQVIPVPAAGGDGLVRKLGIFLAYPQYARAILGALREADAVHVRAPANISLLAILILSLNTRKIPRWVKYAGNWKPESPFPLSYTLQRFLLRHNVHRGAVTVNGRWEGQPQHIITFNNPCLSIQDIPGTEAEKPLKSPVRLLFVGALTRKKGVLELIAITKNLVRSPYPVFLDIVGDGELRATMEAAVDADGLAECVKFHGWLPKQAVTEFYRQAHFLLFPSWTEGWPKVISEGMAHGVVPVASAISGIPQKFREIGAGTAVPTGDIESFAGAVLAYIENPGRWAEEAGLLRAAAAEFTYEHYLDAVSDLFRNHWDVILE